MRRRSALGAALSLLATALRLTAVAAPGFSPNCHLRRPRRCGPLISPGGFQLSILHQPRAQVAPLPPNILVINASGVGPTLVCVPAKVGSTAFYNWLYHTLAGSPWPHSGPPYIQDVTSERWANVTTARLARLHTLRPGQRARLLSDASVRRFALTREPLERASSAYYSKVACGTGDESDHRGVLRQLARQAPLAAAKLPRSLDLEREGATGRAPCVGAETWAGLLLEAWSSPRSRLELNPHFLPQADACAYHDIGYHMLIPLDDSAYGMAQISAAIGVPPASARKMARRHASGRGAKPPLGEAALRLISRVYRSDLNLLQFPAGAGAASSPPEALASDKTGASR